jgi:hypothetical protein
MENHILFEDAVYEIETRFPKISHLQAYQRVFVAMKKGSLSGHWAKNENGQKMIERETWESYVNKTKGIKQRNSIPQVVTLKVSNDIVEGLEPMVKRILINSAKKTNTTIQRIIIKMVNDNVNELVEDITL